MRIPWLVVGLVGVIAAPARADVVLSTLDEWDGERRTNAWDSVAEVLTVPADETTLETFKFWAYTTGSSQSYRLLIYEWDKDLAHVVGDELYRGAETEVPVDEFSLQIETIGVELTGERPYAVIVDFTDETTGTGVGTVRDSEFDGFLALTNGEFNQPWTVDGMADMAFEATFSGATPAPGALALLGIAGMIAPLARRRDGPR